MKIRALFAVGLVASVFVWAPTESTQAQPASAQPDTTYKHKPIEILELELIGNAFRDEALMRYVSDPARLPEIREVFGEAFRALRAIELGPFEGCPRGWVHINCACVPRVLEPVFGVESWKVSPPQK